MRIPIIKVDLIIVLCIAAIVFLCCLVVHDVYTSRINECTASPFTYGARQFEKTYKNADVSGTLYVMADSTNPGFRVLEQYNFNSTYFGE